MDKRLLFLLLFSFGKMAICQELSAPRTENVFGGTVWHIDGYPLGNDSSRVIISTKSANSLFYCDYKSSGTPAFSSWQPVPSLNMKAGYGKDIHYFQIHEASKQIVFSHQNQLKSTSIDKQTAVNTLTTNDCLSFHLYDSIVVYANYTGIYHGSLNSQGDYTASTMGSIQLPQIYNMPYLQVNANNDKLYIFCPENKDASQPAQLWKSSSSIFALDSNTTFTNLLSSNSLNESVYWRSFGFAPDGRIFLGGSDFDTGPTKGKWIAWSDDENTWANFSLGIDGGYGFTFDFSGTASNYSVYYSRCYNDYKGDSTQWKNITSLQTHSNDRVSYVDHQNPDIVFCVTDMGIGVSTNSNRELNEFNDGLTAVQVRDIDMTDDFSTAWVAAKSGIWKASNYTTNPVWTYHAAGTPYYSVAMALNNENTVYAGSDMIFKRQSNGSFDVVFDPAQSPWPWPEHSGLEEAVTFRALEVCPFDTTIIMAGMHCEDTLRGGLFISKNAGVDWSQILIGASSPGFDVDVWDIVFSLEGQDTVAYVGVEYNTSVNARSIYRLTKSGANWSVSQDMDAAKTSLGTAISATIKDLDLSSTGDTILAMGTDAISFKPRAFYKVISGANKWTPFTTSGLPQLEGDEGRCITMGIDTLYLAIEHEIYLKPVNESSWKLGYSYPTGTEIYFLYYDELFAGTESGMYGHEGQQSTPLPVELTYFKAAWQIENKEVLLTWQTASETNNSHFEIERKIGESTDWQKIQDVAGAGNTLSNSNYNWVDKLPKMEKQTRIYYRLKQVDFSGGFHYSDVVSLYSKTNDSISVSVYPNPIRQSELRLSSTVQLEKIQLFDLRGGVIAISIDSIENQHIIKIEENIKPGVYLLQTKSRNQILTTKILVE